VLGAHAVPPHAPLDKTPMTWRLMRLLPHCVADGGAFAPLARFLHSGEPLRLLQLAQRLADVFDQYQNYRADWLAAWEQGHDVLPSLQQREPPPVPPGQLWQPMLWRVLLDDLDAEQRHSTRAHLHARVLHALQSGAAPARALARRVLVFGISQMPLHLLQFLAALARHSQVLLAVHNPCRFHWADSISGREWLRMQRRRHPLRGGRDLAQIPLEAMHAHAHPLLAAWGRQSRDHVRQLDAFDDPENNPLHAQWPRVDLFHESSAEDLRAAPLLVQVQQRVRDMVPLPEHPPLPVPRSDRSIVFHSAHSLLRELEVLHDELLHLLAAPPPAGQSALQPYDVVVMLPAIEDAAPAIRAVFGQYAHHDPRHIPFDIADLSARAHSVLVTALHWLLRLPQQRVHASELCDLLEVPAIAARLGLDAADLPLLTRWIAGSGIRWGLHAAQRATLGLGACGAQGSAWFGLQRMLLGYASGALPGDVPGFAGIEPYDEIGGLPAQLAGVLAALLERLLAWWQTTSQTLSPQAWAQHFHALLQDFFTPQGAQDEAVLAALRSALHDWQDACAQANFHACVALDVARQGWLAALDLPGLHQRFRAGGVTFCTLMPMRAIPFEVVCLLGMNEGEYPRRAPRSDLDLMALPGQQRPGDRARRDDDRQLMLEALLSARRTLYISWTGRNARDNSAQPPSVLVAQLRDYLAAGWCGQDTHALPRAERGAQLLAQRTQQHPLQPFSRRYFEQDSPLRTWAREWRTAHEAPAHAPPATAKEPLNNSWRRASAADLGAVQGANRSRGLATVRICNAAQCQNPLTPAPPGIVQSFPKPPAAQTAAHTTLEQLERCLRNPASFYLRQHLQVRFDLQERALEDAELFELGGLDQHRLVHQVQQAVVAIVAAVAAQPQDAPGADIAALVQSQVQRLLRAGQLPLAALGEHAARALHARCTCALQAWYGQMQHCAHPLPRQHLRVQYPDGLLLEDWLDGLRQSAAPQTCALLLQAADLLDEKTGKVRPHQLLGAYLHSLALAANGTPAHVCLAAPDCLLHASAPAPQHASAQLHHLLHLWHTAQTRPVPLPLKTALLLAAGQEAPARARYEGSYQQTGERQHPAWARLYPDFDSLCADGQLVQHSQRLYTPLLEWIARHVEIQQIPKINNSY